MKAGGLAQAFGGNLAIMDIYAAQKVFGRGRHFDRIDIGLAGRRLAGTGRGGAAPSSLGPGFTVEPPSGRGQQFESMLGVYTAGGEHLQPVRALHRDVHHLQLVRHRGDAAPVGDRHPARAGRHARADPHAVSRRERRGRAGRLGRRRRVRPAHRAQASPASIGSMLERVRRRRKAPRRCRSSPRSWCRPGDRRRDQHGRGVDSGAQCGARRSGAGAAEGQIPGARRRREPHAPRPRRCSPRRSPSRALPLGCLPRLVFYVGFLLTWSPACCSRRCSRWAGQAPAPLLEVAAPGRRRAGRRQPDPGAAPHLGHRRRADALAGAGGRPWRAWRAPASNRITTGWTPRSIPISSSPPRRTSRRTTSASPPPCGRSCESIPGVDEVQPVRTPRMQFRGTP